LSISGRLSYPHALDALLPHSGQWAFHYPIFLNTYCLAFHLGRLLFQKYGDIDSVRKALRRQEHWARAEKDRTKTPEQLLVDAFAEKYKVELFIAGEDQITKMRALSGGHIEMIPFTSYRLRWVLLHRKKVADHLGVAQREVDVRTYDDLVAFIQKKKIGKLCIVTDVEPTAKQFVNDFRRRLGPTHKVNFTIRDYWTREEADFYDLTPKLYVFSAPLLSILKQFTSKYCVVDVESFPPFETYVGAYVRPKTSDSLVNDVATGVSRYFRDVFDLAGTVDTLNQRTLPPWWIGVGQRYSRMAHSARQPDPFAAQPRIKANVQDDLNYLRILSLHH